MKITRRQLRRIIKEALPYREPRGSTQRGPYPPTESEPDHMDSAEYDRGYQDGLDGYPVADNATTDYDAGYEDGSLDAQLPEQGPPPTPEEEAEEEMRYAAGRPWEHN